MGADMRRDGGDPFFDRDDIVVKDSTVPAIVWPTAISRWPNRGRRCVLCRLRSARRSRWRSAPAWRRGGGRW